MTSYRICPGKYFAEAAIFINIASVLHVFDITPPLDHNGQPIKIHPRMSDGLVSYVLLHPMPFESAYADMSL